MAAKKRIAKELEKIVATGYDEFSCQAVKGNDFQWTGVMNGPPGTPFAGAKIKFVVNFPEKYPFDAPTVTFAKETSVFAPAFPFPGTDAELASIVEEVEGLAATAGEGDFVLKTITDQSLTVPATVKTLGELYDALQDWKACGLSESRLVLDFKEHRWVDGDKTSGPKRDGNKWIPNSMWGRELPMWVGNGETGATDHEDEGMKRTLASLGVGPGTEITVLLGAAFSGAAEWSPGATAAHILLAYAETLKQPKQPSERLGQPQNATAATLASLSTERFGALAASWVSKVHARSTLTVEVTTLTNKKVILTDVPSTYSAGELKSRFQDEQGVPPEQQNLWFPVPHGTAGAQPAADFKWWANVVKRLEPKLAAAMLAAPLARIGWKEKHLLTSVGAFASLQGAEAGPVRCFMVLALRALPGEGDTDPSGMRSRAANDDDDDDDDGIDERDIIWDAYLADAEDDLTPLRKCFELFDTDKSGTLSPAELKAILTRGEGIIDHESADQIIAEFDADGDGQISIEEFIQMIAKA